MNENNSEKSKKTKTFRIDQEWEDRWEMALAATGLNDSEMVRECIKDGFEHALDRLLRSQARAKKRLESTFRTWTSGQNLPTSKDLAVAV